MDWRKYEIGNYLCTVFVKNNTVEEVHKYLQSNLVPIYGEREATSITLLLFEYFNKWDKMILRSKMGERLSESEMLSYHHALKSLMQNKPVQYVIGEAHFYSLIFEVNENVLIPRPETEELVYLILKENKAIESLLDIGTGSGCIPISIKHNLPNTKVSAIDVSKKALETAERNAVRNNVNISFIEADILAQPEIDEKWDVVVSNPPYIGESEKKLMADNVLSNEPHLALFVPDEDPLRFYTCIADWSLLHLKTGGRLYFEINEHYGNEVVSLLKSRNFTDIRLIKDIHQKDRIVAAHL